ncbi:hypothetical protein FRACYDRAFT_264730 [Fragilariopsis cylindrus CCMP1102]|uniref:Uncharacterized protein n=1 Tax=Fragilariopsis cylindrus CCMP1102 TaxID=635003 RepID=A0A1E7EQI4_9STRA|nr:hypothetical protein FRACYDRAFT_264730 [Fragilariopsis cylindrus CCMP1102]|eukprot:OEU08066.1 hypothetical protein FRACYDRAFT_264730 [Fragilariopsis cylindrus CCMP1102]
MYSVRKIQQDTDPSTWAWTVLDNGRVTDYSGSSSSSDTTEDDVGKQFIQDKDGNISLIQKEEVQSRNNNEPIVTYSNREPNYPINYSCEHILDNSKLNNNSAMTHSYSADSNEEDYDDDDVVEVDVDVDVVLNEIIVPITLEFQINPTSTSSDDNSIEDNLEGLQWSILSEIAKRSGLSSGSGCNIDLQYDDDDRPLLTAMIDGMNDLHTTTNQNNESNNNNRRMLLLSSSSSSRLRRNSGSSSNNRATTPRTRHTRRSLRSSISSLPYPTSVYAIGTTTTTSLPKWTDTCSRSEQQVQQDYSLCYTTQLNMTIKYFGNISESNIITNYIQSIIQNQIILDSKQLYTNDIISLKFINSDSDWGGGGGGGMTMKPSSSTPTMNDSNNNNNNNTNPNKVVQLVTASIFIPLITILVIGVVWYFGHKWYNNNNSQKTKTRKCKLKNSSTHHRGDDHDIETGGDSTTNEKNNDDDETIILSKTSSTTTTSTASTYSPSPSPSTFAKSSKLPSTKSNSPISKSIPKAVVDSSPERSNATAAGSSTSTASTYSPSTSTSTSAKSSKLSSSNSNSINSKSIPISVDSPERSAAGLPPLIVKQKIKSKKLKRQRKNKKGRKVGKKKKVFALVRVNSRDNINELPMISESDSEHCDDEDLDDESLLSDNDNNGESEYCTSEGGDGEEEGGDDDDDNDEGSSSISLSSPDFPKTNLFNNIIHTNNALLLKDTNDFYNGPEVYVDETIHIGGGLGDNSNSNGVPIRRASPTKKEKNEDENKNNHDLVIVETSTTSSNNNDNNSNQELVAVKKGTFEIEPQALESESELLDVSFNNEKESIMERMLPLPWLLSSSSSNNNNNNTTSSSRKKKKNHNNKKKKK